MKVMEIKDFVAQGYLSMLNDLLRPEGLELSTTMHSNGKMELIHVFDSRPEVEVVEPEVQVEPEVPAEPETPVETE